MKVSEILQSSMVGDNTLLIIENESEVFEGHWYEDLIIDFAEDEVSKLTYIQAENKIYMETKEVES